MKMQSLREVLANRDVSMWFQPIFRFGSEQLLAFEALLRLPNHPGLTGPEDAFAVAQHMGAAHDLDLLCVEKALRSARDLPDEAKIFINLDPSSLMHAEFSPEALARLVEDAGVDRGNVVFEVTEKTDAPLLRLVKQVGAIRELGFAMALDDVGAGNSGLEMLRLAHFDYVKIDRSVVLDAMDGGPGRAIILAIVAFARETGAFMIAEGIETPEMLEAVKLDADGLKRFWIQGVQGFLFGEPRPNLEPFVRARGASAA
jgi:EAL domain-containing protein (putative c-di-GMP-specific phosphodiesterase class I)